MAKCPICGKTFKKRGDAAEHINGSHEDQLVRYNMDAYQLLYASTHNGSTSGKCMMCGGDTPWNPRTGKPRKLCGNQRCADRMKALYDRNREAKGLPDQSTMMSDMDHQRELLQHRHISGKYRFRDGGEVDYTGQLERNFLQFCDNVLELSSDEVLPSPETFQYRDPKDGKMHSYCPDYYLSEYTLLVEIKDGGDKRNTNPRFLEETRYKVALKDDAMRKQKKYNYIRIGGAKYGPLIELLYQITHEQEESDVPNRQFIVINEAAIEASEEDPTAIDDEIIDPERVHLVVGTIGGTRIPHFVAITDSKHWANWIISDYDENDIFESGQDYCNFRIDDIHVYRYVGEADAIDRAFHFMLDQCHIDDIDEKAGWNILDILAMFGIWFDDPSLFSNNDSRRCDFVKIESIRRGGTT